MTAIFSLFLEVFALSLLPSFEGRYSYIYGLARGLSPELSALASLSGIVVLSLLLPLLVEHIDYILMGTNSGFIAEIYRRIVVRTRSKAGPYVNRYGAVGLALFVAIPLPGTGVWTGSLAAFLFGVKGKKLLVSLLLGGLGSILIMAVFGIGLDLLR